MEGIAFTQATSRIEFMVEKQNVYLAQWSQEAETTPYVYIPYSVGCIWAYANTQKIITDNYELKDIFFLMEEPEEMVKGLDNPAVFGVSCYLWNWNFNIRFIELLKQYWPDCYVIFGGPHVPNHDPSFFKKYKNLDIAVHQEGELAFTDILKYRLGVVDISSIPGVSYPTGINRTLVTTEGQNRIQDLSSLPSPYTTGLFDKIMAKYKDNDNIVINGVIETNRGCPYRCTFCDWGGSKYTKIKKLNLERVFAEIDWFAKHKYDLILNADANYGIFKDRDMEIAEYMINVRAKTGYPKQFDTSWAKNNNEKTLKIAKKLLDAGMLRRFTASIQTMTKTTLEAVKRKNMEVSDLDTLIKSSQVLGVNIGTELILGMPLETLESWRDGLNELFRKNISVDVNPLIALSNSEISEPAYVRKYGIETIRSLTSTAHGVDEYTHLVISTDAMPNEDFKKAWMYTWLATGLESLGFTPAITKYLDSKWGISHSTFYTHLLLRARNNKDSILHGHYIYQKELVENYRFELCIGYDGLSNLATDLGLVHRTELFDEVEMYIKELIPDIPKQELTDLIKFQNLSLVDFDTHYPTTESFTYNFNEYIFEDEPLTNSKLYHYEFNHTKTLKDQIPGNWVDYIIGARKASGWKTSITEVKSNLL